MFDDINKVADLICVLLVHWLIGRLQMDILLGTFGCRRAPGILTLIPP